MQILKKFKSSLLYFLIRSENKKTKRNQKPKNLDDCKSILVLFNHSESRDVNLILGLCKDFKESGKKVFLLASSETEPVREEPFTVIGKKDLNWFGKPLVNSKIDNLLNYDWDCVLGLYNTPDAQLDYVVAMSNAFTKAGFYHLKSSNYNIMIEQGNSDFKKSVLQLFSILKTIKSRSYEPAI
jgi:hypothetical protein